MRCKAQCFSTSGFLLCRKPRAGMKKGEVESAGSGQTNEPRAEEVTGIRAQEAEGSEAGRRGPGGQQEGEEVPRPDRGGPGPFEAVVFQGTGPLHQAGPWTELNLSDTGCTRCDSRWGPPGPAGRVALRLRLSASLHPVPHQLPEGAPGPRGRGEWGPCPVQLHHRGRGLLCAAEEAPGYGGQGDTCSCRGPPPHFEKPAARLKFGVGGVVLVLGADSAVGLPRRVNRSRRPWAGTGCVPLAPKLSGAPLPLQTLLALSTNQQGFFPLTQRVVPLLPLLGHMGLCQPLCTPGGQASQSTVVGGRG